MQLSNEIPQSFCCLIKDEKPRSLVTQLLGQYPKKCDSNVALRKSHVDDSCCPQQFILISMLIFPLS